MKIEINLLDPASIDHAIQQIEDYKAKMERDLKYIIKEAASRGVDIVRAEYAEAPYPGTKDYRVTYHLSDDGNKATIEAGGESVLFLEFGAGLFKASAPLAVLDLVSGSPLPHGTYGKGKGKNPKGWAYVGDIGSNPPSDTYTVKDGKVVRTMGNDAVPAVWHARQAMKVIFDQILSEVNGKA
jgi:hypothetical protein